MIMAWIYAPFFSRCAVKDQGFGASACHTLCLSSFLSFLLPSFVCFRVAFVGPLVGVWLSLCKPALCMPHAHLQAATQRSLRATQLQADGEGSRTLTAHHTTSCTHLDAALEAASPDAGA